MMWKVHRTIRFESLLGLWTVVAVAAAWNPNRRWRGPGAGLAAGLALLTHPAGILAAGGSALVLGMRRRDGRTAARDLALAVLVLGAVCLPALLYVLQDRSNAFANVLGQNLPHLLGRAPTLLTRLAEEPRRYLSYFAWPALALPLLSWVLVLVLAVRERAPRALLAVVLLFALALALLPNKTELYLTLLAPFLYLLAAWVGVKRRSGWLVGLGLLWVLNLAAADIALLWRNRDCRYREWTQALAEPVPEGASVAGTFLTWFAFHDHRYLEVHRRRAGDLLDARPDYVVWGDHHMQDPLFERLRMELGPFLADHADVVATSPSSCYGNAVLYRPRWAEARPEEAAGWERYDKETPREP
jgi:hypothetical protein